LEPIWPPLNLSSSHSMERFNSSNSKHLKITTNFP
jgi:hypothetical protein